MQGVIPAKAGTHAHMSWKGRDEAGKIPFLVGSWAPAFAGVTPQGTATLKPAAST
jgi:hypothetical protein